MNAADIIRIKELLPTAMGSDELREQVAADILRRSVFSARMESARYLARIREACAQMMEGRMSQATARDILGGILERMGLSPQDGGGISNPASLARLNLIIETQTQMAASVARLSEQTPAVLDMWPAWELVRLEDRDMKRSDWPQRWDAAARAVGFEGVSRDYGRMVALKDSPVWQALGDGAGGFRDTLGNPFPPFAFNSGKHVHGFRTVQGELLHVRVDFQALQSLFLCLLYKAGNIFISRMNSSVSCQFVRMCPGGVCDKSVNGINGMRSNCHRMNTGAADARCLVQPKQLADPPVLHHSHMIKLTDTL